MCNRSFLFNISEAIYVLMGQLQCLQDYGHRVRLATHSNFKEFVLTAGLEFFALGGDPKILAGCKFSLLYYLLPTGLSHALASSLVPQG